MLSNREDQLDGRFARSLELMASKEAHVVSGAAFSLERIAVQSRFDRDAVSDVLCGFLREQDIEKEPRPEAVQTLQVICRVKELWRSPRPNLRGTGWKQGQLQGLDLSGMRLTGSVFEGANLYGASLAGADLFRGKCAHALLLDADLTGARLRHADLSMAVLGSADLEKADLTEADLTDAFVSRHTNFSGADLSGAKLSGLGLGGVDLSRTNLDKALTKGAKYDSRTTFPPGFDPEARGMILDES